MSELLLFDWSRIQNYGWLLASLAAAPLLILAWWKQIFPHQRMVWWSLLPAALACGVLLQADTVPLVVAADLVLVGVAAADAATLPRRRHWEAARLVARTASLGAAHFVDLRLDNNATRSMHVTVKDDVPPEFVADPDEFELTVPPSSRTTLKYQMFASRRGAFQMRSVYLRVRSRLGLWQRHIVLPVESTVHVYPDMKQLSKYAVLARTDRLSLIGVRRTRRIGQDNEFERLRDYTQDDNYKHIEWRATARRNKLTVKDFQTSQSQRIVFLIDCGRMMTNEAGGMQLLDHALNAMLMMSYVALRQGDSVGLICFSNQVHTYVPPKGGMDQMNRLIHASFDRFPQLVESRYDEAFLYLATRCKKRALVVLMTNIIDEVNALQVEQHLASQVGRHLPMGVLLRDPRLFEPADVARPMGKEVYRAGAAADILSWRHQTLVDLEHKGVLVLDTFPKEMTAALVNRYLNVKARHLL